MLYNKQVTVEIDQAKAGMMILDMLKAHIKSGADIIMRSVQEKAKQSAPAHIAKEIERDEAKEIKDFAGNDAIVARIHVSVDKVPDAGAWEYGSGIWAEESNPKGVQAGKYPIEAVNAQFLHFWWEKRGKWFKGKALPIGHPGIRSRSYMRKSLYEAIPLIYSQLLGVKNVQ